MNRIISVKGTGNVSVAPDMTTVSMTLRTLDRDYEKSMSSAAEQLSSIRSALQSAGFTKEDIKTTSFNVITEHESVRDENGNYKTVFSGYSVIQGLKIEFGFDTERLSKILNATAKSMADPDISINFTVKDKDAVNEKLLTSAAENARAKAAVLASSSGVELGKLISIHYNWTERDYLSRTEYGMDKRCMAMNASAKMDFTPDDISVSDSATFIWEIV